MYYYRICGKPVDLVAYSKYRNWCYKDEMEDALVMSR